MKVCRELSLEKDFLDFLLFFRVSEGGWDGGKE